MQRIFSKKIIFLLALSALLYVVPAGQVQAKSATWTSQNFSDSLDGILYDARFCYSDCGGDPDQEKFTEKYTVVGGIGNPSASITHAATIIDNTTGANISDGNSVSVGDTITITPQANQSTDISWFATGYGTDSPYGTWGGGATYPSGQEGINGWLNFNSILDGEETFENYANMAVQPTTPSISTAGSTAGLSCTGGTCKVTSAGTIVATISYPATSGKFYYSYYKTGQLPRQYGDWTGPDGPVELTVPMADVNKLNEAKCYFTQSDSSSDSCLDDPAYSFVVAIPIIPITFNFNAIANPAPPTAPTVSGPQVGDTCSGSSYTYTFTSTDSAGNTLRYGVDWNDDGVVDEWIPASGYVNSGTPQSTTHSWNTSGAHTFKVIAQDSKGANSGWTTYTTTISMCAVPVALLTASPSAITTGDSSTLQWTCTNSTSASIDNGVGQVTPVSGGSTSVSPTIDTNYTLTCTGPGGQSTDSASVTVSGEGAGGQPGVSCSPSPSTAAPGTPITWTPTVSGFDGPVSFNWLDAFGPGGNGPTYTNSYNADGSYSVHVVASNDDEEADADCSAVTIESNGNGGGNMCSGDLTGGVLTANPDLVQQGGSTNLSWTGVTNVSFDSCSIENITDGGVLHTIPASECLVPGGSIDTNTIMHQTKFCMVCGGTQLSCAVVNIVPAYKNF